MLSRKFFPNSSNYTTNLFKYIMALFFTSKFNNYYFTSSCCIKYVIIATPLLSKLTILPLTNTTKNIIKYLF